MAGNKRRRTGEGFRTTGGDHLNVPSQSSTSQPTFLSTFDRESRYPIFNALCDCLSIAEIVFLTQTCKKLSGLYQYLLPVQWDIDKALRRYVDDPYGFRSQMAKHDALIFGYFATEYFDRVLGKCKTLEVAVRQGLGSELFRKYLLDVAGYEEVKFTKFDQNHHLTTTEIRVFKRNADSKIEIRLYTTICPPAQSILHRTQDTAGLNILSWNKAYSVFPLPTFISRKCYLLQDFDESTRKIARHRSRRGWSVQGVMWPEEKRCNHPIRERRRIGDRYTWTIPFDTRKIEWSKTPDYVLEYACFTMDLSMGYDDEDSYDRGKGDVRYYTIKVNALESKVLKHTYLYGNELIMMVFIYHRLHSSIVLELRKLGPAERPANYDQILRNPREIDAALRDFDRPASWTYRDDEFPIWYKAFEKYYPDKETEERDG